jgi:pyridoxal/pyridoxine/pyridoxamine kinase
MVNLLVARDHVWQTVVRQRDSVPHGTGDVLAALFFAFLLRSRTPPDAQALATGGLEAVIDASEGRDELNLIGSQEAWAVPAPWPVELVAGKKP